MEEEKKLNVSKIIITVISALILVLLIIFLTKVLTNTKQAADVNYEGSQTKNASKENIWEIKKNETTNTSSNNNIDNPLTNDVSNQTENTIAQNTLPENTISQNTISDNTATQNTTIENTITDNTINNNNAQENNVQNNTSNENTTNGNQTSSNTSSPAKATTDDKKTNNGVIWLTFDDGPSATITPKVLDILKKENVKATFFVINYSSSNEHLIKRIVAEGHTIGIHGYSHEYSKIYKSKETFMNNIYSLQDKIYKSTGVKSMYIRFPGGSSNTVSRRYCKGIMTELTKEVLSKGFKYYDWNISSGDAGGAKNAKAVYKNVTKNLSKKRGNLVLCHDIHQKTLEALPDIIKYAKKEGYTFARIDDDTPMYAQHINN